jgi:hypothetical protein
LAVGGIDPTSWQTVEFTTLGQHPDSTVTADAVVYQVLHVSQPARERA